MSEIPSEIIQTASQNEHVQVVERLIQDPENDPSADDNYIIRQVEMGIFRL